MDCVLVSSLIWLCVLLQCIFTPISLCQTQETQTLEGRSWSDIYNRSKCQPRWVLLNLLHEFPQFSEFLFKPACVSVQRCAGCCLDEAQSCYPLQSQIVKMEVQRTKSFQEEYTNISVIQHTDCECRQHPLPRPPPLRTPAALVSLLLTVWLVKQVDFYSSGVRKNRSLKTKGVKSF
ncbi:snake venom vascular endothelial growth factor toxin ICPP-like isoform X4 [Pyxicephalus adspersus]|uniref:snake venom vascular endothelial growth factor toxin ICPP-like isoform X4 n=1 Tax=Pyxicephalus adspersus TaxID=30357 RepID=UPI003B58CA39